MNKYSRKRLRHNKYHNCSNKFCCLSFDVFLYILKYKTGFLVEKI